MRKVKAMRDSLSVVDGLVLINARLYVPKGLRRRVLERLHPDPPKGWSVPPDGPGIACGGRRLGKR